jgi:hypothetical protein
MPGGDCWTCRRHRFKVDRDTPSVRAASSIASAATEGDQDQLVNRTVTTGGAPLDRVRHGLRGVPGLTGEAILWIDCLGPPKTAGLRKWAMRRAGLGTRTQVRWLPSRSSLSALVAARPKGRIR